MLLLASRQVGPGGLTNAIMTMRAVRSGVRQAERKIEEDEDEGGNAEGAPTESKAAGGGAPGGAGGGLSVDVLLQGMLFAQPILEAEARGDRRWCADPRCHAVDLHEDFDMCPLCFQLGYCSRKCQKRHWKEGGHKAACVAERTLRIEDAGLGDDE